MGDKEIVWTHPGDGLTWITIPSPNVYIHVSVEGPPAHDDFVTLDEGVAGVTKDEVLTDGTELLATHRKATIEEIAARDVKHICEQYGFDVVEYHIVDREVSMNTDNYFRDAWEHDKGVIGINMTKAAEVHKKYLREMRGPALLDLDLAYMKADEKGDTDAKIKIAARKQELRDITKHQEIAAAKTPEQLKQAAISVINP